MLASLVAGFTLGAQFAGADNPEFYLDKIGQQE
jgi:hypothetical protein